jgi:hypothetical protein
METFQTPELKDRAAKNIKTDKAALQAIAQAASGSVVTPERVLNKGWVVIKHKKISAVSETLPNEENAIWVDTNDIIFPGFIDLQWVDYFSSFLHTHLEPSVNPTHGSGWIISVPFYTHILNRPLIPPTAVGGLFQILS